MVNLLLARDLLGSSDELNELLHPLITLDFTTLSELDDRLEIRLINEGALTQDLSELCYGRREAELWAGDLVVGADILK